MNIRRLAKRLTLFAALLSSAVAYAGVNVNGPSNQLTSPESDDTDRFIVKLRDARSDPRSKLAAIGGTFGERLDHLRAMSGGAHVVRLGRRVMRLEARELARRLATDPRIESIEPDAVMHPLAVPNDTMYGQQWHYFEAAGGINLPAAWDISIGSSAIRIAVIDTGVVPHADLADRTIGGYDFIIRGGNGADPGDYGCNGAASSWHGTHVAGTLGAATNNGVGVAGINWVSKIVPVRVLGKCGGYTSDIVDGMRWAAGIDVVGTPANPYPARVENLSLGGGGACSAAFQSAVDDVVARGTVVVVAAGNSNVDAANAQPANCNGVIAVAATTRNGSKATYSNFGAKVAIAAPGGGGNDGVLSTLNTGTTVPAADSYAWFQGTSMATPHVSGVVSLMLSGNPSLTPAQVLAKLQSSARVFPTGTGADCTKALCGAGILNAAAALTAPTPAPTPRVNFALAGNGGSVSASSIASANYPPTAVNNGDRRGSGWGAGGGWADGTPGSWPDWVQVDFGTTRTVAEIDVFSIQDNYQNPQDPNETMTFSQYGLTNFEVQYWTASAWQTVPGGSVTGNNKVWRKLAFAPISTPSIRVLITGASDAYSRLAEIEAYEVTDTTPTPPSGINFALQTNGAIASASSSASPNYPAAAVNNGDRRGSGWGAGGGWADGTPGIWPDVVRVDFNGAKSITEIDIFSIQDAYANPQVPTSTMTFSQYGIIDFDVQYWDGSTWVTVPGGSVTGNDKVWRQLTFPALTTTGIQVVVRRSSDAYSRIAEIEAYGSR